jgi:hypothetical protein
MFTEYDKYDASMLVLDVQSLVGITSTRSDSSMGESFNFQFSDA